MLDTKYSIGIITNALKSLNLNQSLEVYAIVRFFNFKDPDLEKAIIDHHASSVNGLINDSYALDYGLNRKQREMINAISSLSYGSATTIFKQAFLYGQSKKDANKLYNVLAQLDNARIKDAYGQALNELK